jgi:serine protease AprX
MSKKNLPIKVVLQRVADTKRNKGGGDVKFFGEVTQELQNKIISEFEHIADFYKDVFTENEQVPAVGKIIVKSDAIAKSHKPNDLCKKCPIIGGADLDVIYINFSFAEKLGIIVNYLVS